MGWLAWYSLASMATAYVVVRIIEYLFGGVLGGVLFVAKPVVFVASWSAMTAYGGMQAVTKRARRLRLHSVDMRDQIDAIEDRKERQS